MHTKIFHKYNYKLNNSLNMKKPLLLIKNTVINTHKILIFTFIIIIIFCRIFTIKIIILRISQFKLIIWQLIYNYILNNLYNNIVIIITAIYKY